MFMFKSKIQQNKIFISKVKCQEHMPAMSITKNVTTSYLTKLHLLLNSKNNFVQIETNIPGFTSPPRLYLNVLFLSITMYFPFEQGTGDG